MVYILLVEDDIQFNKIVCSYLTDNGYSIVGCHSAAEALEEMEKMSFDMIISDIMMKDVDGFEFAEMVRNINKDIPFLFLTARDELSSKEKGYRLHWQSCLMSGNNIKAFMLQIPPSNEIKQPGNLCMRAMRSQKSLYAHLQRPI